MANNGKSGNTRPSNSKPTTNRVTIDRDSGTGRFVTPEYARRHPRTTEQERYRRER